MAGLWSGAARGVAVLAILALGACSGGGVAVSSSAASVAAPSFGDTDPTNWPGRAPGAYPVHGIDVARYQSGIDWPTARANGVSFAFIKATEGGDRVDARFAEHWAGARAAGGRCRWATAGSIPGPRPAAASPAPWGRWR